LPDIIHYSKCLFVPKSGAEEQKSDPLQALNKQYAVLVGFSQWTEMKTQLWQFILLQVQITPGSNRRNAIDPTRGSVFKIDENS
jgi:hypothetical protein